MFDAAIHITLSRMTCKFTALQSHEPWAGSLDKPLYLKPRMEMEALVWLESDWLVSFWLSMCMVQQMAAINSWLQER